MGTATSSSAKKSLGVRVTPEQSRILTEAAKREHRSVSSFVVQAAMNAASAPARKTPEEIKAILNAARAKVHIPPGRDILEEFLAERRAESARE